MNRSDVSPLIAEDRWASTLVAPAAREPSMRIFGLIMLVGFGILGGLLLWGWQKTGSPWRLTIGSILVGIGALVFVWSLIAPRSLPPVYRGWMRFGQGLGTVVSTILLTVTYLVVVTPIGLLMRLVGTDPLERRIVREAKSYWRDHGPAPTPADYTHLS